jgi:trans-aconitate 2-methyltransferase
MATDHRAGTHQAGAQRAGTGQLREWNAAGYDALPLPHERWGQRLLDTLPLTGDETVLDVGAGTGRDTAALLDRLPRGHVMAVDGSAAMLDRLRRRLAGVDPARLTVLRANLAEPLVLDRPVDAVFSVATLHWLPDHPAVFRSLAGVLRPGGLLRAEWGGAGNCATVETALAGLGLPPLNAACNFATDGETAQRLRDAGFTDVHTALVPDPARLEPGAQLEAFLGTVVLGSVLEQVPAGDRAEMARRVAARLPAPAVDYVRLQASARLPA